MSNNLSTQNQVTDHMNRDITKYIATQNTITEHMNRDLKEPT